MDARSLTCPHCGAAADPTTQRCKYCKARLATVSCPSCLSLMFDSSTFCPSCGARRSRTEQATAVKCPACKAAMVKVSVGDTELLDCEKCDGLWVDADAFERICSNREAQAAVLHQTVPLRRDVETRVSYRPCPRCGSMMNRVNFARVSGTVVDVCKGHGTFLDRGELQSVVQFIQGGGLERARQRQMDDLREQEQRLRDQETRLRNTRGGVPADRNTSFGGFDFSSVIDLISRE